MNTFEMKLQPKYCIKLAEGTKTIEVRLFDDKRRQIKIGDIIEFQSADDQKNKIKTEVIGLLNYKTFSDLFSDIPSDYFGEENKETLLQIISKFYSKELEEKYTVLGIKIKLVK